jgi:hypothetical protein
MANKNDDRILLMRKQIAEKKEKIGKIGRFVAVTNLVLNLDGVTYNLNVLGSDKEKLQHLLIKVNSYFISAISLKLNDEALYSGYTLKEWMTDIQGKLEFLSKKEEEKKLAVMEAKLSKMLSDEKQIELELDEMASFLND